MEAEADHAAGQILFSATRFSSETDSSDLSIKSIQTLSKTYGNTLTAIMWRFVEDADVRRPMFGRVTGHPHPAKWRETFDASNPARYYIQSRAFR
jgi:hypothetical protein